MVRDTGFEPVTPTVSMWCSTTELTAHSGQLFSIFLIILQVPIQTAQVGRRYKFQFHF